MTRNLNPFDGYDDDLALRLAIERSLAQEIHQGDSLTSQIASVLDIIKQTKSKINELIEYDVNPVSCDAKDNMNNRTNDTTNNNTLDENQRIIREQDREYLEAVALARLQEYEFSEEEEEEDSSNYEEMIHQRLQDLGHEPENGIMIGVQLPINGRITRKFVPESLGKDVYIWVSAQESMINSEYHYGSFNITAATGVVLDMNSTLSQQNVASRTLFSLILRDE